MFAKKPALARIVLLGALALSPAAAIACRSPPEPDELKDSPADTILLVTIKDVRPTAETRWSAWAATATVNDVLLGKSAEREIEIADQGPGSCQIIGKPRLGKYYVLYLHRHDRGTSVTAMPFWWAWRSGDPRVAGLRKLFPLGPVREPTHQERNLIHLAEQRTRLHGDYTRVYARSSAGSLRVKFFRSKTPQLLMLDYTEEMPTRESCRCDLHEQSVDLQDLWEAGKLPEFKPGA